MSSDSTDIIIFGGTFDPPHRGHLLCIEQALSAFPKAQLLVMLSPAPAAADGVTKDVKSSRDNRLAMVQLLLSELPADLAERVDVRTDEFQLPIPNYSINTLRHLQTLYPDCNLALLIGRDQWLNFNNWRDAKDITVMASLLICDRPGAENGISFNNNAEQLAASLGIKAIKRSDNCWYMPESKTVWQLLDSRTVDVSSSEIRKRVARVEQIDQLTLNAIRDYIAEQKLYQER